MKLDLAERSIGIGEYLTNLYFLNNIKLSTGRSSLTNFIPLVYFSFSNLAWINLLSQLYQFPQA